MFVFVPFAEKSLTATQKKLIKRNMLIVSIILLGGGIWALYSGLTNISKDRDSFLLAGIIIVFYSLFMIGYHSTRK